MDRWCKAILVLYGSLGCLRTRVNRPTFCVNIVSLGNGYEDFYYCYAGFCVVSLIFLAIDICRPYQCN